MTTNATPLRLHLNQDAVLGVEVATDHHAAISVALVEAGVVAASISRSRGGWLLVDLKVRDEAGHIRTILSEAAVRGVIEAAGFECADVTIAGIS